MSAVRYQLRYPITTTIGQHGVEQREEMISEVTLRRPVAGDFREIDREIGDVAKSLAMIANLSGLMTVVVNKLDVSDMTAIGDIIEGFTAPGPSTGGTR